MPMVVDEKLLTDIFKKLDKDNSGYITADELKNALSFGVWTTAFNPESYRLMIGMFDKDDRGSISFEHFGALWRYMNEWLDNFKSYDKDDSGNIDANELYSALTSLGYRVSDKLVNAMKRKFDRQGKGRIQFDDFVQCCIILQTSTSAFRALDGDNDGLITINYEQFLEMVYGLRTYKDE